jgi:hypothetical protein
MDCFCRREVQESDTKGTQGKGGTHAIRNGNNIRKTVKDLLQMGNIQRPKNPVCKIQDY